MAKVHLVNHTHWDREWYFTTADALALSENVFTEIIKELEKNKEAKFCLDGQTSILEDYIRLRPEKIDNIKKLVAEQRLSIGPWYTQTDAFFVDGESIIRNLMIGISEAKGYGGAMKIGYLPDTFGINAQMPTILSNMGIDNIIFWRGINFDKHVKSPYFKWKGLSNKEIFAVNLVDGYGTANHFTDTEKYMQDKIIPATKGLKDLSQSDEIMLTTGGDQLDITPDIQKKIDNINAKLEDTYHVSTYEAFMQTIRERGNLENYSGEFREPCLARVHKSIGSVRYDTKRENYLIEQKLIKRVEPLMCIAKANGIDIGVGILKTAWKKILEGQAHDSMGGCVSDDVQKDILHRFKEANEICDSIENMIAKLLSEKMGLSQNEIIVFNTTSEPFSGRKIVSFVAPSKNIRFPNDDKAVLLDYVQYEGKKDLLIETPAGHVFINEDPYIKCQVSMQVDIPAMGYTVVHYETAEQNIAEPQKVNEMVIANEFYKISVNGTSVNLETKDKTFEDILSFVDCGNDGDTYDFSPLRGDENLPLHLSFVEKKVSVAGQELILEGTFELPKTLEDRLDTKETDTLKMTLHIGLSQESERVECKLLVENNIYSHRVRAKFNLGETILTSFASVPFGYLKRTAQKEKISVLPEGFVEMPIDIEPFDNTVSVPLTSHTLTVFGKGVKEYQLQENYLEVTLFATTAQLGKPNLLYRPGRASGDTTKKGHVMIETPMAQLIGDLTFEFAFAIQSGGFSGELVSKLDHDYKVEQMSYQYQTLNKFINRLDNKVQPRMGWADVEPAERTFSLLNIAGEGLVQSSFMRSLYDEEAFIIRFKNMAEDKKTLNLVDTSKFKSITRINDIEEVLEDQGLTIGKYDTLTLKLTLK